MFRRETPVYLFTGFLESGKTSFILDTLSQDYFATGERTLLIACEEGEVEYDIKKLRAENVYVEFVENEKDLVPGLLKKMDATVKPKRVLIEFNGTWNTESIMEDIYPESWVLTQVISFIDYQTYPMFWNNMRSMLINQISMSDLIVFNRCDETTNRNELRRNMRLTNKKAQIAYDWVEGFNGDPIVDELPFDINASEIVLEDDDYGIWYMDAMESPEKYDGKLMRYNCLFFRPDKYPMDRFVPGRFAMTCCAEDISYLGLICKCDSDIDLPERQWINVLVEVKCEKEREYHGIGPVLYLKEIKTGVRPEDDLVYF